MGDSCDDRAWRRYHRSLGAVSVQDNRALLAATWTVTAAITVDVPDAAVFGNYTGTITHSVSEQFCSQSSLPSQPGFARQAPLRKVRREHRAPSARRDLVDGGSRDLRPGCRRRVDHAYYKSESERFGSTPRRRASLRGSQSPWAALNYRLPAPRHGHSPPDHGDQPGVEKGDLHCLPGCGRDKEGVFHRRRRPHS